MQQLEKFYKTLQKGITNMNQIEKIVSHEMTHIENEKEYTKETLSTFSSCENLFPENFGSVAQTFIDEANGKINEQENPFKKFYHHVLGVKADMTSFVEAYELILKYKTKEKDIGNKIQSLTQQNGDTTKIAALNQDLPCIQFIINACIYRLNIDAEKFKKDQINCYNEEMFQLKEEIIVYEQVIEKIWTHFTGREHHFN